MLNNNKKILIVKKTILVSNSMPCGEQQERAQEEVGLYILLARLKQWESH